MSGNHFGQAFSMTSFGESHGPAIGCIVDGCPPGLSLSEDLIQPFLDKRKPGQSKFTTQRRESDKVKILSGVFDGQTTGTPIMLLIENEDQRSRDYEAIKHIFRPGHADFTYHHKYGIRDYRGGGRSSARETAARVAAGAIARLYLQQYGVDIVGYLKQMGDISLKFDHVDHISNNMFFCPNDNQIQELENCIEEMRRQGDSIGARVNVEAHGVPVGLGEPVFEKIDALLAQAMMSINAVKGVEIGDGFACVSQRGSHHRDEMTPDDGFLSNHCGGTLGGITTGQPLVVSMALKPTSSIVTPGRTINTKGEAVEVVTKGRHDPCVGIRAVPIAEAMMAIVLMDCLLRYRGQVER